MKVLELNIDTKKNIEKTIGIAFNNIVYLYDDISTKRAVFSKKRDSRKIGRGNPLLSRRRLRTLDDVNKKIEGIN